MLEQKLDELLCEHFPEYKPGISKIEGRWCIVHNSGDGREITVALSRGKYVVHGSWPRHDGQSYFPDESITINVSASRGIDALVQGISRRFMGKYEAEHAKQLEKMQSWINYESAQFSLRDEILGMLDYSVVGQYNEKSEQVNCYHYGMNKVCVSGGKAKLETDYLPRDVAIEIINILKKRMKK